MAGYGFKGMGWLLSFMVVAPSCYLVTSQVAAERARVQSVKRAIADAKNDIRNLNIEFKTRSNMAQLERWNTDLLALQAPTAGQYLDAGAVGVAQLDSGNRGQVMQYASYDFADAPHASTAAGEGQAQQSDAPTVSRAVETRTASADDNGSAVMQTASVQHDKHPAADRTQPIKEQKVAMLDEKLLSDSTLGDLARRARIESAVLR
ncbi:hypothetical protein [Stakelama marina]|uniref:Colicin transporter n=1 Tax=Stakelama marina TaxID=2826939 RepID=A0A8T4IBC9_9SPHN|nr:hypothetical protein [Stakelama marina]MBR0551124.1 hypothetical protein [Stakelama marina]